MILQRQRVAGAHGEDLADVALGLRKPLLASPRLLDETCHSRIRTWRCDGRPETCSSKYSSTAWAVASVRALCAMRRASLNVSARTRLRTTGRAGGGLEKSRRPGPTRNGK